ncbi:hypothetical protein C8N43_0250 [Litoreibacter ponti]|uniref:Uncharacterized protein n=1 Tax=Litoreibacter ponti TaxID=1510457 RepID=A0A2T6BHS0_9RHOB|nr:hypothetical protein [Litoreibacter ponti]PTX55611.1 hypothetical protein C8N43_0250 [Litoreibacter ponti]
MLEVLLSLGAQLLADEAVQKSLGTAAVTLGTTAWSATRNAWTRRQDRLALERVRDQFNLLSRNEGKHVRNVRNAIALLAAFDAFVTQVKQERTVSTSTAVAFGSSGSLLFLYPILSDLFLLPALSNEELAAVALLIPFVADPVARLWRGWRGQSAILDRIGEVFDREDNETKKDKSEYTSYKQARAELQSRVLEQLTALLKSRSLHEAFDVPKAQPQELNAEEPQPDEPLMSNLDKEMEAALVYGDERNSNSRGPFARRWRWVRWRRLFGSGL